MVLALVIMFSIVPVAKVQCSDCNYEWQLSYDQTYDPCIANGGAEMPCQFVAWNKANSDAEDLNCPPRY